MSMLLSPAISFDMYKGAHVNDDDVLEFHAECHHEFNVTMNSLKLIIFNILVT